MKIENEYGIYAESMDALDEALDSFKENYTTEWFTVKKGVPVVDIDKNSEVYMDIKLTCGSTYSWLKREENMPISFIKNI